LSEPALVVVVVVVVLVALVLVAFFSVLSSERSPDAVVEILLDSPGAHLWLLLGVVVALGCVGVVVILR
jgi:hypothetical protein